MTCADLETLLTDYVDGTLRAEERSAVESHLAECASCSALARDAAGAVAFMERASTVEAPPELLTRLLFEIANGPSHSVIKPSWGRRLMGKWLAPVLQPRWAMSMAMTVLSFAMLQRLTGIEVRQLRPSDLDPVKVWVAVDDRAHRVWERTVKYYESMRVVFEIQNRLREWSDEQSESGGRNVPTATETK
jgi:anti-sigma factor RsiW